MGWPLVERRRGAGTPPLGVERRSERGQPTAGGAPFVTVPMWPIRLAAATGALISCLVDQRRSGPLLTISVLMYVGYTIVTVLRPIPYRNDARVRLRVTIEQLAAVGLVLITGAWASPLVVCVIPSTMLAGFAAGPLFSAQLGLCTVAAISLEHFTTDNAVVGLSRGGVWAAFIGLAVLVSGFVQRSALDVARRQRNTQERLASLTEANALLFELQRVALLMPSSLDLDEVLDSTVERIQDLIAADSVAVLLLDHTGVATPVRTVGIEMPQEYDITELPAQWAAAMASPRPVRLDMLADGQAIGSGRARSGLYTVIRAHGEPLGFLAIESNRAFAYNAQQVEVVHGIAEPFGLAIANARIFRQIRMRAADDERFRIARNLHDQIGSSLASIGFEVDRAAQFSHDSAKMEDALRDLRAQVTEVLTDVRETLFDLRSDITDGRDLRDLLDEYLGRVARRSSVATTVEIHMDGRIPLAQEREIWQILREAINNAERHAQATTISVAVHETSHYLTAVVSDDGLGISHSPGRKDSYGLQGMRERASHIGATLTTAPPEAGGTEVRVELQLDSGDIR